MTPEDEGTGDDAGRAEMESVMRGAVGVATAKIAEARFNDLGLLAIKCSEVGVSFCYSGQFRDSRRPESKARAVGFIFCGDLPDEFCDMITSYMGGALQDYTAGNKNVRVLYKSNDQPEQPEQP